MFHSFSKLATNHSRAKGGEKGSAHVKDKLQLHQQLEDLMKKRKEWDECREALLSASNSKTASSTTESSDTHSTADEAPEIPDEPAIIVSPESLIWHPNLRQVKCSDTILYRIYPVFWYLDPDETGILTITVANSVTDRGKVILQHTEALPTHLPYLLPQLFKWTPASLLQTVHLDSLPQKGVKTLGAWNPRDVDENERTGDDYFEPDSLMCSAKVLLWKENGPRVQTITFTNTTWARRALKVKCSDNRIYNVSPVHVALEPAEAVNISADGPFHILGPQDVFRAVNPEEIQSITIFSKSNS
ncbi:unnamed protein product, partial [Mesorhabditis belari]|uniref:Major sperm protein n=1 Tax=Mesorhabditis belari TaxID=2138241 RepID=A0AAF3J7Y8_9BILA